MAVVYVTPDDVARVQEILDHKRAEAEQKVREHVPTILDDHLRHAVGRWALLDFGEECLRRATVAKAISDWMVASGYITEPECNKVAHQINETLDEAARVRETREEEEAHFDKGEEVERAHPGIGRGFAFSLSSVLFEAEEEILGPNKRDLEVA